MVGQLLRHSHLGVKGLCWPGAALCLNSKHNKYIQVYNVNMCRECVEYYLMPKIIQIILRTIRIYISIARPIPNKRSVYISNSSPR